jgi:hypothetical protein
MLSVDLAVHFLTEGGDGFMPQDALDTFLDQYIAPQSSCEEEIFPADVVGGAESLSGARIVLYYLPASLLLEGVTENVGFSPEFVACVEAVLAQLEWDIDRLLRG